MRFFLISNPKHPPKSRAVTHKLATPAKSGRITISRGKFNSCKMVPPSSFPMSASATMAAPNALLKIGREAQRSGNRNAFHGLVPQFRAIIQKYHRV